MSFMNILIYRWKAYNDTDIIGSFRLLGHNVSEFGRKLVSYDEDPEFAAELTAELQRTHYDFVFTVNYFAAISDVCFACRTPYVVWTCDNPLISMFHRSLFHPTNYIFTFDKTNELELKGMGVSQVWHLPLAVDTNRLDEVNAMEGKIYDHEISFVGSLYERNTYDKLEQSLPPYLRGYFDAVIEAQLQVSTGNLLERLLTPEIMAEVSEYVELEKSADSFSDLSLIFATTVLGFKVAAEQRSRALLRLAKRHSVAIYSNSNTKELIGLEKCGTVDYWTEMPRVFRGSKINLNMTIPDIKSGIPLRVFDVLGSGGFLLTNFQAEMPSYFEIGKDLVCFESLEELEEKCDYYLLHEEERKAIAQHGHETVKNKHQLKMRLQQMLAVISDPVAV